MGLLLQPEGKPTRAAITLCFAIIIDIILHQRKEVVLSLQLLRVDILIYRNSSIYWYCNRMYCNCQYWYHIVTVSIAIYSYANILNPHTSPCPALSAHPRHCLEWYHEAESLMTDVSSYICESVKSQGVLVYVKKWVQLTGYSQVSQKWPAGSGHWRSRGSG